MTALAPGVRLGSQPGFEDPLGSVRDHIQEPGGTATVSYGSYVQDDGDVPVPIRGVAPLAGYVSQAPDYRAARNALAPAASTPLVLTSNAASQHCMVWLNALTRHLQPQAIQARESAQIRVIKDSIGHVEVFQMDGVGISIIERPRPLPGHDTYTLKCEEPVSGPGLLDDLRGLNAYS